MRYPRGVEPLPTCKECKGSGYQGGEHCAYCNGTGIEGNPVALMKILLGVVIVWGIVLFFVLG